MLPELQTKRLRLRELEVADAPAMQLLQNCPYMWALSAVEPEEFADARLRIENYMRYRGDGAVQRLSVYSALLDGAIIGSGSLVRSQQPGIAGLSVFVGQSYAGLGYGTEIVRRLLAYGFQDLGLHRIEADVAIANVASQSIMEKLGMRREGVLRDCIWAQGLWWSEIKFARLASDGASSTSRSPLREETA